MNFCFSTPVLIPSPDKRDYRNVGIRQKPVADKRTYQDLALPGARRAFITRPAKRIPPTRELDSSQGIKVVFQRDGFLLTFSAWAAISIGIGGKERMPMPLLKAVVVEDYRAFRRLIRLALEQTAEVEVIAEVSDGLEAVQEAKELQPDLILLDIGLPKLNGLEAGRRIREVSPNSNVLFLAGGR
jgi:hypothetical protein